MSRGVYYNEFDRQKAAWLRHLIEEGAIAHGVVDERSIAEVQPEDLDGFAQCHFFAGVGVWSYALRLAGWPDDRPVWTGSCPCGPFSVAGKKLGFADPRHLWPTWFPLIRQCRPDVLFGEQSDDALAWIDLVSTDMEDTGYAFGAPDLPAAGFRGAHIRQRFYWVADANNAEWWSDRAPWHDGHWPKPGRVEGSGDPWHGGGVRGLANPGSIGIRAAGLGTDDAAPCGGSGADGEWQWLWPDAGPTGPNGRVGYAGCDGSDPYPGDAGEVRGLPEGQRQPEFGSPLPGGPSPAFWLGDAVSAGLPDAQFGIVRRAGRWEEGRAASEPGDPRRPGVDWLFCRDRRWRPVEPGSCPLVDETPGRMGRLRGYGDAIDAEAATNFIEAYIDAAPPPRAA